MIDMVPKAIMLNLVAFAKDELQRELLENLYRTTTLDDLLKESEVIFLVAHLTIVYDQPPEGVYTDGRIVDSSQRDCFSSLDS
jgi:Dynamin GTPase effector domain